MLAASSAAASPLRHWCPRSGQPWYGEITKKARAIGWLGGWVGGCGARCAGARRAANVPGARRVADRQRARAGIGRDIGAGARRDWLRHVSGHAPACSGWSSALVRLQLVSLHRTRNQGGSRSTAGEAGPMHRRHAVLRCRITEVPHALHPPTLSPTLSLSLSLSLSLLHTHTHRHTHAHTHTHTHTVLRVSPGDLARSCVRACGVAWTVRVALAATHTVLLPDRLSQDLSCGVAWTVCVAWHGRARARKYVIRAVTARAIKGLQERSKGKEWYAAASLSHSHSPSPSLPPSPSPTLSLPPSLPLALSPSLPLPLLPRPPPPALSLSEFVSLEGRLRSRQRGGCRRRERLAAILGPRFCRTVRHP